MKAAVIVFPGANCDRDLAVALRAVGTQVTMVWHKDTDLPDGLDLVALPGGFTYGDYLRCGAIAARSPVAAPVARFAARGGHVLGICNGFQILTEMGLLPGALMRNGGLKFVCRAVDLEVATTDTPFTAGLAPGARLRLPVAHHDGNYRADAETLAQLAGEDRIVLRYLENPNGSAGDVAAVVSRNRRVLGMMPHPERAVDAALGGRDGARLLSAFAAAPVAA